MSVLRYRHLFVCIVLIAVLLSCTVIAGAEFTSSDSVYLKGIYDSNNSIYNHLTTYLGGTNGIHKHLLDLVNTINGGYGIESIYFEIDRMYDRVTTINTSALSIAERLLTVNTNLSSILTKVTSADKTLSDNLPDINSSTANIDTNTEGILTFLQDLGSMNWLMTMDPEFSWFGMTGVSLFQLADGLRPYFDNNGLSDFTAASESNFTHFFMDFGSDIASNVSSSVGLFGGFQDFFSLPNVDISSTFEQVESGYSSWFSADTAQALTVGAGSAAMMGISLMGEEEYVEPDTPYLDAWNSEVQEILAGGDGEW